MIASCSTNAKLIAKCSLSAYLAHIVLMTKLTRATTQASVRYAIRLVVKCLNRHFDAQHICKFMFASLLDYLCRGQLNSSEYPIRQQSHPQSPLLKKLPELEAKQACASQVVVEVTFQSLRRSRVVYLSQPLSSSC